MSMLDELTASPNANLAALVELYQDGNNGGPGTAPTTLPAPRLSSWGRKGTSHFKSKASLGDS